MSYKQVLALDFRDDNLFKKLSKSATSTHVKERPFKESLELEDTNKGGLTAK